MAAAAPRPAPHPSRIFMGQKIAAAVFVLLLVGIVANAVVLQNGPHPAPLLGHGQHSGKTVARGDAAAQREAARPEPAPPGPAAAEVPVPAEPDAAAPVPVPATPLQLHPAAARPADGIGQWLRRGAKPQPGDPAPHRLAAAAAKSDGIAQLLRESAPAAPGRAAAPAADPTVLAAQRALAKLGYAVNPDGRLGDATRRAIEKFQRDRHHTVAAGVTPKLLHELGAAAAPPPG